MEELQLRGGVRISEPPPSTPMTSFDAREPFSRGRRSCFIVNVHLPLSTTSEFTILMNQPNRLFGRVILMLRGGDCAKRNECTRAFRTNCRGY